MQDPDFKIPLLPQHILDGIHEKYLDIKYGKDSSSQALDIYYPTKGTAPYPVIVHFHGGAFMIGTKRDDNLEPMLRGLERGYAVVSVEYRMSQEARFPAMIYDAKTAIRYLRAHSKKLRIDPNRIAAWGPSAGGYIVSMLGTTGGNPAFEDLSMGYENEKSDVQAVVDWCGPCGNFLEMDKAIKKNGVGIPDHEDDKSPESLFLGVKITDVPELCRLSSPYIYVNETVPPFLIHHGGKDPIVPVQQSETLAHAIIDKAGADRVQFEIYEGKGHHGEPWYHEKWLSDKVFDFLDKVLKTK